MRLQAFIGISIFSFLFLFNECCVFNLSRLVFSVESWLSRVKHWSAYASISGVKYLSMKTVTSMLGKQRSEIADVQV